jgi:hypothetical protein
MRSTSLFPFLFLILGHLCKFFSNELFPYPSLTARLSSTVLLPTFATPVRPDVQYKRWVGWANKGAVVVDIFQKIKPHDVDRDVV